MNETFFEMYNNRLDVALVNPKLRYFTQNLHDKELLMWESNDRPISRCVVCFFTYEKTAC